MNHSMCLDFKSCILLSIMLSFLYTPSSHAKKSVLLSKSGAVTVGKRMPFFAGWKIGGQHSGPTNLNKALKANQSGYVITLCAKWCTPCLKGLQVLARHQDEFKKAKKQLIVIVADTNANAQYIYKSYDLKWATFILDEFKNTASKFSPSDRKGQGISLPRTFVLDRNKVVTRIISEEGPDFIPMLMK